MRTRILILALLLAAVLFAPVGNVEACGPFFEPEVFVSTTHPDDLAAFGKGQLGILQAGFDSNEYAVAYRYLNGGKLSAAELHAYVPPPPPPSPPAQDWTKISADQLRALRDAQAAARQAQADAQPASKWLSTRAEYLPPLASAVQAQSFPVDYGGNIVFDDSYLNCPDPAFITATLTLSKRANAWGKDSKWLADWIHGQDAVFSNCAGKSATSPAPAAPDSPALLKADRAYQIASATFYAKQFDDAASQFAAIAADRSSPWAPWGQYLAARAMVRKAFANGKTTDAYSSDLASYDAATMQRAQTMLEALLAQPNPTPSRPIVQDELNFIRIRTDPENRAAEVSAALAGPAPDPNFLHDLDDLSWLYIKSISIKNQPPLMAWITAWRTGTAASAFTAWQQGHQLPWLVVAIAKAAPTDAFAPALIDEAAKITPESPAYDTVFYHRVRLLIALQRTDEARALLDAALPALRNQKPSSKRNALLGERLAVARDFREFLQYAPRNTLAADSEGAEDLQQECNLDEHAVNGNANCPGVTQDLWFDDDAAVILNQKVPLSLLIEAANTATLPQNLRQSLAVMAWTRAVLLQDTKSVAALAPLLPKDLEATAGSSADFPADLAILRNPGMRPYLEAGIPRVASFSQFDEFRNNWWCKPWQEQDQSDGQALIPLSAPAIIAQDQQALAASEYQSLQQLPDSAAVIGQRVIDYANAHPNDPQVPEALALTVRATHYACQSFDSKAPGASTSNYTPVGKAAFEFLHKHYPKSPWTAKTPYYY
jgi:hypothetical protein